MPSSFFELLGILVHMRAEEILNVYLTGSAAKARHKTAMIDVSSHFQSVREVLGWADTAIQELAAECKGFLANNNFALVTEIDFQTRQSTKKLMAIKGPSTFISRRATEALSHARHSFDQSVFAALVAIGKAPKKDVFFPWSDNPTDLEYRLGAKTNKPTPATPTIPAELWPIIRSFEPCPCSDTYTGGDDQIREMTKVANRKHTVRLTFQPIVRSVSMDSGVLVASQSGMAAIPSFEWDSVNNNMIMAVGSIDSYIEFQAQIDFYISFNEPGLLQGQPVVELLSYFTAKAKAVADGLEREANRIVNGV